MFVDREKELSHKSVYIYTGTYVFLWIFLPGGPESPRGPGKK